MVKDVSYFGTMMVQLGLADGMVSGAVHTTAHTIRPALEVVKTRARRLGRLLGVLHVPAEPGARVRRLRGQPRSDRRAARRHRHLLGGDRGGVRHRTAGRDAVLLDRYLRAPGSTSKRCRRQRRSSASARPNCWSRDRSSTTPRSTPPSPGPSCRTRRWPAGRPSSSSPTSTPATTPTRRCSGRRTPSPSAPFCRALRKPVNDLSRGATVRDIINTVAITAIQAQLGRQ